MNNSEEKITEKKETLLKSILLFVKDILIIILIILFLRAFIFVPFKVSGQSMDNSLYDKEYVIVRRISFINNIFLLGKELKRGDVIVFSPLINRDEKCFLMNFGFGCKTGNNKNSQDFVIKRIIGMPGDEVKISKGFVFVKENGKEEFVKLEEGYLNEKNNGKTFPGVFASSENEEKIYEVPDGEFFVLGDNRMNSLDSRSCFYNCELGNKDYFIEKENIIGKMFLDFGYFDKFGSFKFEHSNDQINKQNGGNTFPKFFGAQESWNYPELENL